MYQSYIFSPNFVEIPVAHIRVALSLYQSEAWFTKIYKKMGLIWLALRKRLKLSNLDLAYLIPIFYFYFVWYLVLVTQSHQLAISKWIIKELGMHA